jgi:hypothetical protein
MKRNQIAIPAPVNINIGRQVFGCIEIMIFEVVLNYELRIKLFNNFNVIAFA